MIILMVQTTIASDQMYRVSVPIVQSMVLHNGTTERDTCILCGGFNKSLTIVPSMLQLVRRPTIAWSESNRGTQWSINRQLWYSKIKK